MRQRAIEKKDDHESPPPTIENVASERPSSFPKGIMDNSETGRPEHQQPDTSGLYTQTMDDSTKQPETSTQLSV